MLDMNRVLDVAALVPTTPLDPGTVVDGAPETGSRALAAVAGVEVGVWEMTPGTATDVEVDEVLPREVGATAYRIVVEALTNVRRHAPKAGRVHVAVRCVGDMLEASIVNDIVAGHGAGDGRRHAGSGLIALAAAAEALDGTLVAGAVLGDWRVTATLPLKAGGPRVATADERR